MRADDVLALRRDHHRRIATRISVSDERCSTITIGAGLARGLEIDADVHVEQQVPDAGEQK